MGTRWLAALSAIGLAIAAAPAAGAQTVPPTGEVSCPAAGTIAFSPPLRATTNPKTTKITIALTGSGCENDEAIGGKAPITDVTAKSTTQSVGADCAAVPLALKQQKLQLKWQAHDAKNKRTTVATTNAFVTFLDVAVASHVTVDGALITDPRKAFVGSFPLLLLSVTDEAATVNTACTGAGLHTLHLAGTAESLIPD